MPFVQWTLGCGTPLAEQNNFTSENNFAASCGGMIFATGNTSVSLTIINQSDRRHT